MLDLILLSTSSRPIHTLTMIIVVTCCAGFKYTQWIKKFEQPKGKNTGSPGLVVMGRDSCSEGCGFESQHQILDGHFSHIVVVKIVMFVWKD